MSGDSWNIVFIFGCCQKLLYALVVSQPLLFAGPKKKNASKHSCEFSWCVFLVFNIIYMLKLIEFSSSISRNQIRFTLCSLITSDMQSQCVNHSSVYVWRHNARFLFFEEKLFILLLLNESNIIELIIANHVTQNRNRI